MISLDPPYQIVDGYTVLHDHADPLLFYVLPSAPSLGLGEGERPALSLLQYLGGGTGAKKVEGGLLTLTTELRIPDEALPGLVERLAKRTEQPAGSLRVVPVSFESGTVELIALGSSSGSTQPPSPGGDPSSPPAAPFDVRFLGSGKPSLAGTNPATFQLVLDATAAELTEKALEAPDLPLIVVYRLSFAGLRPSFRIDLQADWHKVYSSLENKAKANVYYVAADVDVMINKALEESNIRIDETVFGTGEESRAAAERARKQLTDWILERMFVPLADPKSASANSIGRVIDDTVWSLARTLLPGVSYKLRKLEEDEVRMLSARMDESVAELREVVPQGTVGGLIYRYRVGEDGKPRPDWPRLRDKLVTKVNLDGFPRLEVQVACEDRFASDGLSQVQVELARLGADHQPTDNRTVVLRSASEREQYVVNLLGRESTIFSNPYQYRVELQFDPTAPFGPHAPITSNWRTGSTTELFVDPREWVYTVRDVQISLAPTFSFAHFPAVTVELRFTDTGDANPQTERVELKQDQANGTWSFRSFASPVPPYEYRVTYHRPAGEGGAIETPWRRQMDGWLAIPDPLPWKRTLNLFTSLPWQEIQVAFIQIRYQDEANGIEFEEQIDLNPDVRYLRRDYPIADRGARTIAYRLTMLLNDGRLLEGSWRETEDDRLLLDRRLVERRVIAVNAIGGSLVENHLAEVRLQLQVRDPATGQVREETELGLKANGATKLTPWEYLLGDPPVNSVFYKSLFVDNNGFTTRSDWKETEADRLVIQLRTRTVIA